MKIVVQKPEEIEPKLKNVYYEMVCKNLRINLDALEDRIEEAALLSFCIKEGNIIAIRAIKKPSALYIREIFSRAGLLNFYHSFKYESGWSVTLPEYRCQGLSFLLLKKLLSSINDNVYATIRLSNIPPQKLLTKIGFVRSGNEFNGREEPIILWLYNHQLKIWRELSWL